MKKNFARKLFSMIALLILPATLCSYFDAEMVSKDLMKKQAIDLPSIDEGGEKTDPLDFIGYGYNITAGVPIYGDDALIINHPILDRKNTDLLSHTDTKNGSEQKPKSHTSSRFSDIVKMHSRDIEANLGFNADISSLTLKADVIFDRSVKNKWGNAAKEEYSYYIYRGENKLVYLTLQPEELGNYLDPNFKKDILAVKNPTDAKNIFNTYGTHLLDGYKLGGLLEMTNYYAQKTSTYVRNGDTSFKAQVEAGYANMGGGNANFSFKEKYGSKDNNSFATNQYECHVYGGCLFPSLSIDHVFSKDESWGYKEYTYNKWLRSINQGENLVITGIPNGSKLIPIWDLLPINAEYNNARKYLMEEFNRNSSEAYKTYYETNKDIIDTNIDNSLDVKTDFTFKDRGFTYDTQSGTGSIENNAYCSSYVSAAAFPATSTNRYPVKPDSRIYMDYDSYDFEGQEVVWTVDTALNQPSKDPVIRVLDSRNGIFEIDKLAENNSSFKVNCSINGAKKFTREFLVNKRSFSGGDGTLNSPYLIATLQDLQTFTSNSKYWVKDTYFKMISDIDCKGEPLAIVGDESSRDGDGFYGNFDGGYHQIKNFNTSGANTAKCIFFSNYGKIENLTIDYDMPELLKIETGTGIVAGLVAINHTSGKILNCSVNNFDVNYTNKSSKDGTYLPVNNKDTTNLNKKLYIGGICGYNMGLISDCSLSDSQIVSTVSEREVDFYMVGGIVGYNNSTSTNCQINKCLVETSYFNNKLINASWDDSLNVGILVGRSEGNTAFKVTNCLVRRMDKTTQDNESNFTVFAKNDTGDGMRPHRYIGGVIGCAKGKIDISNVVLMNQIKLSSNELNYNRLKVGLFVGFKKDTITYTNCFVEIIPNETQYLEDNKTKVDGIAAQPNITTSDLGVLNSLADGSWDFEEEPGVPNLNLLRLKKHLIQLDYSKTKVKFALNEEFSYSNLSLETQLTDGTPISEHSLVVDSSQYDKNVSGTYNIFVKGLGTTKQYPVTVGESPLNHIYAEEIPGSDTKYYTEDKTIKLSGMKIISVLNDGTKKEVPYDETGQNGFTYVIPGENGLVVGKNVIEIHYKDCICTFEINAIDRIIKSIEILDKTTLETRVYSADTNIPDSDLDNIQIKITYTNDDTPKIISGKECDFVYSRVNEGENTIHVLYKMVNADSFKVKGRFNIDISLINEFIRLVNAINTNGTMKDEFDSINLARAQLAKIDSRYYGDASYQTAKANLQKAINDYNTKVDNINNGFKDTVEIAESFNVQLVAAAGLTTLAAIVGYVIKKHL